jgi:hypothetical protein
MAKKISIPKQRVCRSKKSGHFVKKWLCGGFKKSSVRKRTRDGNQWTFF